MTDVIRLTLPAGTPYRRVATMVIGGVGSRVELPYERIDDLQLAVSSVLQGVDEASITVELEVGDDLLSVAVGPLAPGGGSDAGLLRILSPLVDSVRSTSRDGSDWLVLAVHRVHEHEPAGT